MIPVSNLWRSSCAVVAITLFVAFAAFFLSAPVAAGTLDAKALNGLVSGHSWQVQSVSGPGHVFWAWKSDGSLCLQQEATGSCIDSGRWKLNGDSVCYELSWYGKSGGYNARCVRVVSKGDGHYQMVPVDGVTPFNFTVAK